MASGYDLSVSTFSPDGKVFQVEYAHKAVEHGALSLAAVFKDGVVLAAEKWIQSPLVTKDSRCRLFKLDDHACAIVTGSLPDGKNLVERARLECSEYRKTWGVPISGNVLADRIGLYVHGHTAVWSTRPVGASIMIAVHERRKREPFVGARSAIESAIRTEPFEEMSEATSACNHWSLWIVDPTGAAYKYKANSQGQGALGAKTDLAKLNFDELNIHQGIEELTKIIYKQHDDNSKEKQMALEVMILQGEPPKKMAEADLEAAEAAAKRYVEELDA